MKVLLTGASGFLGNYLAAGFKSKVLTLGRGRQNDIICDLSLEIPNLPKVDMVVHNAGLAHRIPKNPEEERQFYKTNFFGTQNLLSGLTKSGVFPESIVFISTVAVYGLEKGEMITEKFSPKPETAYAKSKYEAELLLRDWAGKHKIYLTILRLPLVAGAKATPGNLGAMLKAIRGGYYFKISEGHNRKSIVLAEDIAQIVPNLIHSSGTYNLTDGYNPSLVELEDYLANIFGRKIRTINPSLLRALSLIGDHISMFPINSYRIAKLNESLTFDDSKAKLEIGWKPRPVIGNLDLKK